MTRLLLLSGNAGEAARYLREKNLMPSQVSYISTEDQVRGYENPDFVVLPGFWKRHDCIRIWAQLLKTIRDGRDTSKWVPKDIQKFLEEAKRPKPAPVPPTQFSKSISATWTNTCLKCGAMKEINEHCPKCGPPKPAHTIGPVEKGFKSIKPPRPPKEENNGFKRIKP